MRNEKIDRPGRVRRLGLGLGALLLVLTACGVSEGDFIAGADFDGCLATVPYCNTSARCIMTEYKYIKGAFPGSMNFIVTTPADTTIIVKIFFKTRIHPAQDTEIFWWDSCSERYTYESLGDDVFSLAGGDRVFAREEKVHRAGDHLIEVYSDATTDYFMRIELVTPM